MQCFCNDVILPLSAVIFTNVTGPSAASSPSFSMLSINSTTCSESTASNLTPKVIITLPLLQNKSSSNNHHHHHHHHHSNKNNNNNDDDDDDSNDMKPGSLCDIRRSTMIRITR